jgi:hypothetical protein
MTSTLWNDASIKNISVVSVHQEQVHGRAGQLRLHHLRVGRGGLDGHAQTQRKNHSQQPARALLKVIHNFFTLLSSYFKIKINKI